MHERFLQILDTMDVPPGRKDLSDIANLRWLARNMGIRNSGNPDFAEASQILRTLLRQASA